MSKTAAAETVIQNGRQYGRFLTDRHNWAEQVLPINREAVRCGYCGMVAPMAALPIGGCIERTVLRELAA